MNPFVLQTAESLEAKVDAVRRAVWTRNDGLGDDSQDEWMTFDIFDEFAVVRQGRQLLKVPYTFDDNGVVEFGTPEKVEMDLEPVQMSMAVESNVQLLEAEDGKEGWVWSIQIIEPGWALTGDFYPTEALTASVELFDGAKVYAFPDVGFSHKKNALKKGFREIVGWISDPKADDDGRITGTLNFVQAGLADEIRTRMVRAWKAGKKDLLGLSIDARGTVIVLQADNRKVRYVQALKEVLSVDVVLRPAAGGKFTELVASVEATQPKESQMREKLLKLLRARRPEALAGIDEESATVEQLLACVPEQEWNRLFAEPTTEEGEEPKEEKKEKKAAAPVQAAQEVDPMTAVGRMETRFLVGEMLQASKLPEKTQGRIRKRFDGQVATRDQIQAAIDEERDYLAELNPAKVQGLGGPRGGAGLIVVGSEHIDRLQAGLDRAFGLEPENPDLRAIKPLGLRQLYNELTRGYDPEVTGVLDDRARTEMLQADFDSTTLPRVAANTMHRKLLKDYKALDYGERNFVNVVSAADFRTREAIRVGYFGDIPAVDPESADYAELAAYGEEYETYSVGQKGAIVTITRKHIINDDVGAVAKVVSRLGRAARRTFAKFVYSFFTTNPAMQDTYNWFSANHSNLLAAGLSVAQLTAARLLLFNQTELSSAEKLGLDLYHLLIPVDLEDTAIGINQTDKVPGSANNDANRWHHFFGQDNERIHVIPFWTDANDWVVTANPADADIIEVAFLNGQEEPELFLADQPTVGTMFTADELKYKIRHEYGGVPVDYRSVVKAVVV